MRQPKEILKILLWIPHHRNVLTEAKFTQIQQWKKDNGKFAEFDDIFKIKRFRSETIEKLNSFCNQTKLSAVNKHDIRTDGHDLKSDIYSLDTPKSIIYNEFDKKCAKTKQINVSEIFDSVLNEEEISKQSKKIKQIKLMCEPKLTAHKADTIKTFVSIHMDSNALTWTCFRLDRNKNGIASVRVTDWKYSKSVFSKRSLWESLSHISNIIQTIPETDVYVIENQPTNFIRNNINVKLFKDILHISQAVSILVTFLLNRNPHQFTIDLNEDSNVYLLGRTLMGRLYSLYIGTETVSTENLVKSLLDSKLNALIDNTITDSKNTNPIPISFNESIYQRYNCAPNVEREFLGKSMLIGLAFLRLGLIRCPAKLNKEKAVE